ncbi:MAG TPA: hypothetical protein VGC29_03570 [Flavisolibacter sp.]
MKKFLGILAIAVTLVACNDSADGTDAAADSARIADSIKRAQDSINASMPVTPIDSLNTGDSLNTNTGNTAK